MDTAIEILMVEDNPGDIRLIQEYLRGNTIRNHLSSVKDQVDLKSFLQREDTYAISPKPDVILISLSLLFQEGLHILKEIKQESALKHIPLVVLTAFEGEEQVLLAEQSNFALCITKPLTLDDIYRIIRYVRSQW